MPLRSFLLQGYWGTHRSSLGPNQRVHKTVWCSCVAAPFSHVWYLWAKFISDFWNKTAQAILLNENQNVASKLLCIAWPKVQTVQSVQHLVLLTDIELYNDTFQSKPNRPLADNEQFEQERGGGGVYGVRGGVSPSEQIWVCPGGVPSDKFEHVWRGPCEKWLTNGIMGSDHIGTLPFLWTDRHTRLKPLPSRNFVDGR